MQEKDKNASRREFIQQSAVLSAGIMLANSTPIFSQINKIRNMSTNIKG